MGRGTGHARGALCSTASHPQLFFFFPYVTSPRSFCCVFWGGVPAPCSSVAESWLMADGIRCLKKKSCFTQLRGAGRLGNGEGGGTRSTARAPTAGAAEDGPWRPPQTQAEVKAEVASLPVRHWLSIPRGRPASSPARMLGAPLAGLASVCILLPADPTNFGWSSPGELWQAKRQRGRGGAGPVGVGGQCLAGTGALGTSSSPAPAARLRPAVRCCHHVSPSVSGHPWRFGRTRCSAFSPFPFSFAHFIAAVQELVSDICRIMAC